MMFIVQAPSMETALETALLDDQSRFALAGFEAGAEVDLVEKLGVQELAYFQVGKFSITRADKVIDYDPDKED